MIRGINDHEIESLARICGQEESLALRFIEFMPLDSGRAWHRELVVPGREILARALQARFPFNPLSPATRPKQRRRWVLPGGQAEIGIIAPVSEPFCGHCNRIRLTADGKIRTCLFSVVEHDLRPLLRAGCVRRGDRRLSAGGGVAEGSPPSHRRIGFRPTAADDELHWRLITSRSSLAAFR